MHVLIVPSWYTIKLNPIRGIFFKEQAIALQKEGIKVTVAFPELWSLKTLGKNSEKIGYTESIEDNIKTYRYKQYNYLPKVPYAEGIMFYRMLKILLEKVIEKEGKPDVIHVHSCLWAGYSVNKLSKEFGIPFILTEHSSAFSLNLIKDYQKRIVKDVLENASEVIVVGKGLKDELEKYKTLKDIKIIPNIVNIEKFYPAECINEKFIFFSLGLLEHKKGMDILIQAFSRAFHNREDVELIIGGDGPEKSSLQKLIFKLNLENKVKLIGKIEREDVPKYMNKCNCFVLSSRVETFGVVFVEALACGKPVIGCRTGGPDTIINDNNGYLIKPEDCEELTGKLKMMVENYAQFNSLSIREDCVNRFSEEFVAKSIINIYDKILTKQ